MAQTVSAGTVLSNGARFHSISRDYTETVSVVMFIKGGLFREDKATNGLGSLFARTWIKSGDLLEKVEYVGGRTGAALTNDYLEFSISVPTVYFESVIADLKKQIATPVFKKEIFDREKRLALQEFEAEKDDPSSLAYQLFMQATYKNHPYALKSEGESGAVEKLTLKDVESYYKNNFSGADMIVVMAGKYTAKQEEAIKQIFASVPKGKAIAISCNEAEIIKAEQSETTDSRIQQAKLFVAYPAPSASSPEYVYTKLLSDLLGGGMSSPYFTALRKEKGYAYSVGTMYPSLLCTSRFTGFIELQEENIGDAVTTMQRLNSSILKTTTKEDLEKSKNHIIGQVLAEAETNSRTAWYSAFFENLGLGFDYVPKYIDRLRATTLEDLKGIDGIFKKPHTIFIYRPAAGEAE